MTTDTLTIDGLERWVFFGATWRVVDISRERAVVDLCTGRGLRSPHYPRSSAASSGRAPMCGVRTARRPGFELPWVSRRL